MTIDLEAIKARLAAATPGTWTWEPTVGIPNWSGTCLVLTNQEDGPRARLIGTISTENDARLVAHAPSDIADLVAAVERLRVESDEDTNRIYELQKQVDSLQEENFALRQRANPSPARPAATARNMAALQTEVERLRASIVAHRKGLLRGGPEAGLDVTEADRNLWGVLDA